MKENDFINYKDSKRIFINTFLGCHSKCSYCYLPTINIKKFEKKAVELIIQELNSLPDFIRGKNGTILSIGCYSECWDISNRKDTIKLLNALLEYGNPIQIATKQLVKTSDLKGIFSKITYEGQLTIYISCSTISSWEIYEKGTLSPQERFQSFTLNEKGIPTILYIKPVLNRITIKDIDLFSSIIKKYKLKVIVGSLFVFDNDLSLEESPISSMFKYHKSSEETILKEEFSKISDVYEFSTDIIEYYRKGC